MQLRGVQSSGEWAGLAGFTAHARRRTLLLILEDVEEARDVRRVRALHARQQPAPRRLQLALACVVCTHSAHSIRHVGRGDRPQGPIDPSLWSIAAAQSTGCLELRDSSHSLLAAGMGWSVDWRGYRTKGTHHRILHNVLKKRP